MSNRIYSGITAAIARVFNVLHTRRVEVPDLYSPEDVNDDFAPDLAWNVGLADDVRLRDHLGSADEYRRWAALAGDVWANKGEAETYRQIVQAATGTRIYVMDWHNLVAAPALFPGIAFTTISTALNGHWHTTIGVEDLDGTLNRDAAETALDLVRPIGEGILCVFVEFVENWRRGLGRWTTVGVVSDAGNVLTLGPDGAITSRLTLSIPAAVTGTWDAVHYEWVQEIVVGISDFQFRINGANEYTLRITAGVAPNNVALYRNAAIIGTATLGIALAVDYYVVVSTYTLGSGNLEIQVRIDGSLRLTAVDAAPFLPGPIEFRALNGTNTSVIKWASVISHAPEIRSINL